jgi:hypothetical protein
VKLCRRNKKNPSHDLSHATGSKHPKLRFDLSVYWTEHTDCGMCGLLQHLPQTSGNSHDLATPEQLRGMRETDFLRSVKWSTVLPHLLLLVSTNATSPTHPVCDPCRKRAFLCGISTHSQVSTRPSLFESSNLPSKLEGRYETGL